MGLREDAIGWGFKLFGATRLHRAAAPFTQGLGAILMLHRVREPTAGAYAPNRGLEITPAYLDAVLTHVRRRGFRIVSLDEAVASLSAPRRGEPPLVALTFDDGTRDTMTDALPVLERHGAPFTVFVTPGFADRSARMWWIELEDAILRLDRVRARTAQGVFDMPARDDGEKAAAFTGLYRQLRAGGEAELLAVCADLCAMAGVDSAALVEEACLDWSGIEALAAHPLVTIGAHTLTHPRLAKLTAEDARREIGESRHILQARLGRAVEHFAYPVGDPTSAGAREFTMAAELGFRCAVTTRPGMLFPGHADHRTALPRLSINGAFQSTEALDVLLSGAPFFLVNGGRRLAVA